MFVDFFTRHSVSSREFEQYSWSRDRCDCASPRRRFYCYSVALIALLRQIVKWILSVGNADEDEINYEALFMTR